MNDWIFLQFQVASYAKWYVKAISVVAVYTQLLLLIFVCALVVRLAWGI